MSRLSEKIDNLREYLGGKPRDYYHSVKIVSYDSDDPLAFYLNPTSKADYPGPFDREGIPLYSHGGTMDYLPILISFYGLGFFERYRRSGNEEDLARFSKVVDWLAARQDRHGVWLTPFPMKKFGLHQPYPSAIVQGVAISGLVRAYRLFGDERFMESATRALAPYHKDLREGGVASYDGGQVFYEEYPAVPYHHVLNGFIYAMWGLVDLKRAVASDDAESLYEEGLRTLIDWLPRYDMGYWSLYHLSERMKNPATVNYHRLHIAQMEVMHLLTGRDIFKEYRSLWSEYMRSPLNALRTLPAKLRWHWTYRP